MNASTLKQKLKKNKIARIGAKVLLPNPYPKYYEKLDVDRNIILYESFYGKGMTCGPKAIFDQLTKSIVLTSTKHVWVMTMRNSGQQILKSMKNAIMLSL